MANKLSNIFADTDVCLDLLTGRMPFHQSAVILFSLADSGKIQLHVSALSFANIDYLLRSRYNATHSRKILADFKQMVTVLPVTDITVDKAILSQISDFEDALQHACAAENKIPILLTRNIRDFKKATVQVLTPETYLSIVKKEGS
jgi:predicted nucleic acid-binding protein